MITKKKQIEEANASITRVAAKTALAGSSVFSIIVGLVMYGLGAGVPISFAIGGIVALMVVVPTTLAAAVFTAFGLVLLDEWTGFNRRFRGGL